MEDGERTVNGRTVDGRGNILQPMPKVGEWWYASWMGKHFKVLGRSDHIVWVTFGADPELAASVVAYMPNWLRTYARPAKPDLVNSLEAQLMAELL